MSSTKNEIHDAMHTLGLARADINSVIEKLEKLNNGPTVSERKWNYVSDNNLPTDLDWTIVAIRDEHGDTPVYYTDFGLYIGEAKGWYVDGDFRKDIYAWAHKPEPPAYKKEVKVDGVIYRVVKKEDG